MTRPRHLRRSGLGWPVVLLAVVASLASGCTSRLVGSGHVVTKHVAVASFDRLEVGSAFEVNVSIGSAPGLTLHVDDNLLSRVDTGVSGGTLRIGMKPSLSLGRATLKADVTATGLHEIRSSGASHVTLRDELSGPNLVLKISGASEVDGSIKAQSASFEVSGASRTRLTGTSDKLSIDGSGASQIELADLQASTLEVNLSGATQATVGESETLSVNLSGASQLSYKGMPRIVHQQISGASQLNQI
jgi:Putative auto-transporter adhesin, head GIN domain